MSFSIEKFLFDTPLYSPISISDSDYISPQFECLFFTTIDINIDGYNPWNKADSSFKIKKTAGYFKGTGGIERVDIECKRFHDIFSFFILWNPDTKLLEKIGQFPTVADFHISEIKQYKKVLSQTKLKEFTRAIGLAANGVGIGSFVYLRRIFEHLIVESFKLAKENGHVDQEQFGKARMDEKIKLLEDFLPKFLVENKSIYSILSLGIHELDEKSCLTHFDALRLGIEIILDEKLDELRKKEKIEHAKKKLLQITGELTK